MRLPHFELVRTAAGWHGRFISANGRTVWTTEVYRRRRAAVAAVDMILAIEMIDVREVDER